MWNKLTRYVAKNCPPGYAICWAFSVFHFISIEHNVIDILFFYSNRYAGYTCATELYILLVGLHENGNGCHVYVFFFLTGLPRLPTFQERNRNGYGVICYISIWIMLQNSAVNISIPPNYILSYTGQQLHLICGLPVTVTKLMYRSNCQNQ